MLTSSSETKWTLRRPAVLNRIEYMGIDRTSILFPHAAWQEGEDGEHEPRFACSFLDPTLLHPPTTLGGHPTQRPRLNED